MTWLDRTWQQHALEAMLHTFKVDDHLKKEMIEFLLDEGFWDRSRLTWDAAVARFNACTNPNKSEYFKLSEAWALMKRFKRHEFALSMIEDLGFDRPRPTPTEARRQDLLLQLAAAMDQCEQTVERARAELRRLEIPETESRVHPSIAQGSGARFSLSEGDDQGTDGPGCF